MLRDAFAANLALASEKFRNGRSDADGGRTGTCQALVALIRYAPATRPDVAADLESVVLLATKLGDVDVGNVDRMFKPPKKERASAADATTRIIEAAPRRRCGNSYGRRMGGAGRGELRLEQT